MFFSSTAYAETNKEDIININMYFRPGLLYGNEIEKSSDLKSSDFTLNFKIGIEKNQPFDDINYISSMGLGYSYLLINNQNNSHSIGTLVTWKIDNNWKDSNYIAVAMRKSTDCIDYGIQFYNSVIYKDIFSFDIMWQMLPGLNSRDEHIGRNVNFIYGGCSLYGKYGWITLPILLVGLLAIGLILTQVPLGS